MEVPPNTGNLQPPAQRTYKLREALLFGGVQQPWRTGKPELSAINPIPSMICEDESRFLHWIARSHLSGRGCVVDLGPLAGGSTHALCSGLALNPRAAGRTRVHAYDLWRFVPGWESYFPAARLKKWDDLLPLFAANVAAYAGVVVPHQGNMLKHRWTGGPIEILFVDAAKSVELWKFVLREFLPHCIPGHTLIVHQDWVCAECPWIHLTTARLAEYLAPVDSPDGATVAFLLRRPIPRELLEQEDHAVSPLPDAVALLERSASWMVGWYRSCVELAVAHYLVIRGHPERALQILERVRADPAYSRGVERDAELVLAAIESRKHPVRASLSRWRDTCSRAMRRTLDAMGGRLG